MKKYYIDYNTGAGNEFFSGTLEDCQAYADENISYTQMSVKIYAVDSDNNVSDEAECVRKWQGIEFNPDNYEDGEDANIIKFGTFGYYEDWSC